MAAGKIKIEVDTEEADKWLSSVLWRKCEEELPQPEEWVIATNGEVVVEAGIFNGDWLRCGSPLPMKAVYSKLPTHWMPFPKPPND